MAPGLVRPKSVNPSYRDTLDSTNDDEIRMKALLNAALDSREDLFDGPIPRAASTPPSRIQFQNPKFQNNKEHQQDIAYAMQNMALNNVIELVLYFTPFLTSFCDEFRRNTKQALLVLTSSLAPEETAHIPLSTLIFLNLLMLPFLAIMKCTSYVKEPVMYLRKKHHT